MRLLADENFPKPTVEALRAQGHDVTWARTVFPGAKDTAILRRAIAEKRIVVTLDKDFSHLLWPQARVKSGLLREGTRLSEDPL
jgi:predicted nuclease of predicted toxin-antitoxin system